MAHAITMTSSVGDSLILMRMHGEEALGRLYAYEIEAISRDVRVDLRSLLGTAVAVTVKTPQGYTRYFHGIVAEGEQRGFEVIQDVRYAVYGLRVVPKPWLLTRTADCRIFKNQSVPDIVKTVLADIGYADVRLSLSGDYPQRDYCVQYRESAFAFISRLMEQEGIYYYFNHTRSAHTMVLADSLGAHAPESPFQSLPYVPPLERDKRMKDSVFEWRVAREATTSKVTLDDYDYLKPKASLRAVEDGPDASVPGAGELAIYDYPGLHTELRDGQRYAQVRAEALAVPHFTHDASTDACGLRTGALFRLRDFPLGEINQEYLVVATRIRLVEVDYVSGNGEGEGLEPFRCDFNVIAGKQPFRTAQVTPRPVIAGLQTAVVDGQDDEDIVVDQYGRIQVNFFWAMPGRPNAKNSCLARVAQGWAGKKWGALYIPRVGQEVVVSFLEGNPDRPLIIGSVYNQDHMPPYALPGEKTRSGIVSRSLRGGPGEANEIRFEDRKGAEELLFHAQRDSRHEAENDHFSTIARDRTDDIGRDDSLHVGRTLRIEAGEEIELVTGLARIVMKRTGEIQIMGTTLRLTGTGAINLTAGGATSITSGAAVTMTAGATVAITAAAAVAVTAGAALTLTSTAGPATLTGLPPLLL
jgi:type VI secretion system secreted protein VgrG